MSTLNRRITNFFNTQLIFITLVGVIGFFSLIQLIMFGLKDDFAVVWVFGNDITSTATNAWLGWLIITVALIGSCITISGEVFLVRGKKKFIYFIIVGECSLIFYGISTGLWFTVIDYIFYFSMGIIHYKHWTDESKKESVMTKKAHIFITTFTIIYLILGLSLTTTGTIKDPKPILDPLISALIIFGWFNITRKNKWGYLVFLTTDMLGILMFTFLLAWGAASSFIIYVLFDISAFIVWTGWDYQGINLEKIVDHYYAEANRPDPKLVNIDL